MCLQSIQACEKCIDRTYSIEWLVPTQRSFSSSRECFYLVDDHTEKGILFLFKQRLNILEGLAYQLPAFTEELATK